MDNKLINNEQYIFRIITVGNTYVGKSCMLLRFTDNRFMCEHDLTIGVEFGSKIIKIDDSIIKMHVWDTAGQEVYRSVTRFYYKNVCGVILVYDITKRETFNHIENWIHDVNKKCPYNKSIIIVGNKIDLETHRKVSYDEGHELAKKHGFMFIETSVKTGHNVQECFSFLIK